MSEEEDDLRPEYDLSQLVPVPPEKLAEQAHVRRREGMRRPTPIKGVLHLFSETGTEGGWWALQNEKFIEQTGGLDGGPAWLYDGLEILKDGDWLTIFDKEDPTKEVWRGKINLNMLPLFAESAGGLWIHADQEGVSRETWARWFFEGYPAWLVRAKA